MFLRSIVTVVAGLVLCLILTNLAATIASARSSVAHLDVDFDSALHADYSKDPQSIRFVPIDPEIIEAAREDGSGDDDVVEFVPIFRIGSTPGPSATPSPAPGQSATTPTPQPTLTWTPQAPLAPTQAATPVLTTQPTPTPTPTPTPRPGPLPDEFSPVADSIIRAQGAGFTFGSATELRVDPHPNVTERALIRFDVSGIPVGATIGAATLTVCPTKARADAAGRIHQVYRALGHWTEAGVMWDNQPPVLDAPTDSSPYLGDLECVSFDVTGDVAAWIGGAANFGWLLRDGAEGATAADVRYASRENADITLGPKLTIAFTQ